jgi:hypothetical protein
MIPINTIHTSFPEKWKFSYVVFNAVARTQCTLLCLVEKVLLPYSDHNYKLPILRENSSYPCFFLVVKNQSSEVLGWSSCILDNNLKSYRLTCEIGAGIAQYCV